MQAKISNSLLAKLTPAAKPYEVNDTELKGFLIRVQPTGTLAYYCAYRAFDGKRNRISLGRHPTVTSAQARDHAKQILAGVIKGENPADRRKATQTGNLFDFLDGDYGPWVIAHRKDGQATIDRIRSRFQSLKATSLDTLTPAVIERWRTKRLSAGISSATVNRDIASLRSALSKAVEWKLIDSHPMASVKPLKIDSSQIVRFLSEDEEKRLRSAIDSREEKRRVERDSANNWRLNRQVAPLTDLRLVPYSDHLKPMILISINTGIRQGELFNLRWQDVDLDRANLTITGNTAKSGKTRHIPLNSEALHAFKEWATGSNNENLVFPSTDGKPFDNVKKSWAELLKDAKIDQFRWHDMRHHFASRLVMAGVDINTVRELLGHGDLKMTLRYAHLAPEHKAAAVAKLVRQND